MDEQGDELQGPLRRFHTLNSLGLASWSDADARHLRLILESCRSYFFANPYDRWFKRLDEVLSGVDASFYSTSSSACHLDLIPYATTRKWTELTPHQRSSLLAVAADTLALLLRDSPLQTLVLNGQSVVNQFQEIAGIRLERQEMASWSLPRNPRADVVGIAYRGVIEALCGIKLPHNILVLGFNHNLQSSFGVTTKVVHAIRGWIAEVVSEVSW